MLEEQTIQVLAAMIKAPLALLEVERKEVAAHAAQPEKTKLSKAPETLDAVDVGFAPNELVSFVVDAVVTKTRRDWAVVG